MPVNTQKKPPQRPKSGPLAPMGPAVAPKVQQGAKNGPQRPQNGPLSAEAEAVVPTSEPSEHNPSCPCPKCAGRPAEKTNCVRQLSSAEIVEFISRPIYLGPAVPLEEVGEGSRRGPKRKRTAYDAALDRRRLLYHKLVRLSQHRANKRADVAYDKDLVEQVKADLIRRNKRVTPSSIAKAWPEHIPCPSEITIWRRLKELREIAASRLKP
jgi:hypothetical protein